MAREATGHVTTINGKRYGRFVIGGTSDKPIRLGVTLAGNADVARIARWAARMRAAGYGCTCGDPKHRKCGIADMVRRTASGELAAVEVDKAIRALARRNKTDDSPALLPPSTVPTFSAFGDAWVKGELHKRWPDHVRPLKDPRGPLSVLRNHVPEAIGLVPLSAFTLEHAEAIMAGLPATMMQSSRRRIGATIRGLLSYAVYPGRYLPSNPIPVRWLPRASKTAFNYLYPDEDRALLGCVRAPIEDRMFWGVLAREGMRKEEAASLAWADVDLGRGAVRLDQNKTGDPRAWALDPGVVRALVKWRRLNPDEVRVFPHEPPPQASVTLRRHLRWAGVTRAELFESTKERRQLRAHDMRATFCTVNLALGKPEAWIMARTGHSTSAMLGKYHRQARTWDELHLGGLAALDEAIPEFRPDGVQSPNESPKEQKTAGNAGSNAIYRSRDRTRTAPGADEPD